MTQKETPLRKSARLVLALVLATSGLLTLAAVPAAAACSAYTYGTVSVSEDNYGAGDRLVLGACSKGLGWNLRDFTHSQSGVCNALYKLRDDWNDCINSISINLNTSYSVCVEVYKGPLSDPQKLLGRFTELQNSGWNNLYEHDTASSIRFGTWTWTSASGGYYYCDFT